MRLSQIEAHRFDRFEHLALRLGPGVNVIHGQDPSEPRSLGDFLRWMLFAASHANQPLGIPVPQDAEGTLEFRDSERTTNLIRRLRRDGKPNVSLESPNGPAELWDRKEWRHDHFAPDLACVYAPDATGESIYAMLRFAESRGISLAADRQPPHRLQELRLRADEVRRRLQNLPWRGRDLASLLDHQRVLQQRLDGLLLEQQSRRNHLDLEYQQLTRQIEECERDVAGIRDAWRVSDARVNDRREEVESNWRRGEDLKREFLARKRQELNDVEGHIHRVRDMLTELRNRHDAVVQRLDDAPETRTARRHRTRDSRCMVETLSRQLEQLSRSLGYDFASGRSHHVHAAPVAALSGEYAGSGARASLESLRAEVGHLCRTLQELKEADRQQLMTDESEHLAQSESVFLRWLDRLEQQREHLRTELADAERRGASIVMDASRNRDMAQDLDDPRGGIDGDPGRVRDGHVCPGDWRAVAHACDEFIIPFPEEDSLLQALMSQRDSHQRALDAAERRLRHLIRHRESIEGWNSPSRETEVQAARRELQEIAASIRTAEERERLERELSRWEDEVASLQRDQVPNAVMYEASLVLRRLSKGRFTRVRMRENMEVVVDQAIGPEVRLESLSHVERYEVELGLRLALAVTLRAMGHGLPLILDDRSNRLPAFAQDAIATELQWLGERGVQSIVLTSNPELASSLQQRGATRCDLRPRAEAARPLAPPEPVEYVERVRFRPRGSVDSRSPELVPPRIYDIPKPAASTASIPGTPRRTRRPRIDEAINTSVPSRSSLAGSRVVPREVAERLAQRGIRTVGDFLARPAHDIEGHLAAWRIHVGQIRSWQQELKLSRAVAEISPEDARVLVRSGVVDLRGLADSDESTLYQAIQSVAQHGLPRPYTPEHYSRERIASFIRAARALLRSGRRRQDRRETASSESPRSWSEPYTFEKPVAADATVRRRRRPDHPRPLTPLSGSARNGRPSPETSGAPPRPRQTESIRSRRRFFLATADPIVNAPVIGPRTAGQLQSCGIRTVNDLLVADPEALAAKLVEPRVTPSRIRQWQSMVRLVCRVPNLRGHDAQVLVACGIRDVEDLLVVDRSELWARVAAFLGTKEAQRALRGSRRPDMAEVNAWVASAGDARALQAA